MVISRAAIMFSNGEVVEGHNYGTIMALSHKLSLNGEFIHGFTTTDGDFVLPKEAATIAFKGNQISVKVEELAPEDLWPEWAD